MKRQRRDRSIAPKAVAVPAALRRWARREWLVPLALLTVTFLVYLPSLWSGFVNFDDPEYVDDKAGLRHGLSWPGIQWAFTGIVSANWHPLTLLSLLLDYELFATKPWGYHLHNLLLHLANTYLLYRCLRLATGSVGRSAVVAGLFALHPLHVESVAWVAERKDVLSTLFGLLALRAYVWHAARPGWKRMTAVTVLFTLSLMAKPMWITLPCLLLLLDYWPLRRYQQSMGASRVSGGSKSAQLLIEKLPLAILAGVFCYVTLHTQVVHPSSQPNTMAVSWPMRLANAVVSYMEYLRQMVAPTDLAVFYLHPGDSLNGWLIGASVVLMALLSAAAIGLRRRVPYFFVGWWWYIGMLVPVIGLVKVGDQARADRYTYVPLVGVFLFLTWGIADLLQLAGKPRLSPVLAGVLLGVCVFHTEFQLVYWENSMRLWEHDLKVTTPSPLAYNNYAEALMAAQLYPEALAQIDARLRLLPNEAYGLQCRGSALLRMGLKDQAADAFEASLREDDAQPVPHYNLGRIRLEQGRLDEAEKHLLAAVDPAFDDVRPPYNLGLLYLRQQRWKEAEDRLRQALDHGGEKVITLVALAEALRHQDKAKMADEMLEEVRRSPRFLPAQVTVAEVLAAGGQFDAAIAVLDKARDLADPKPDEIDLGTLRKLREAYEARRLYAPLKQ